MIIQKSLLEPLVDAGLTAAEIEVELNETQMRVYYALKKHGLETHWTKRQKVNKELRKQGRKQCSKCNNIRKYPEDFSVDPRSSDKRSSECVYCRRPEICGYQRDRYKRDTENVLAISRAWKERNPDKVRAYSAKWYAENKELNKQNLKEWFKKNPHKQSYYRRTREARKSGAPGKFTQKQLHDRLAFYGNKCWICKTGEPETIDHVIPISKTGTNWPANLRPACISCNSRKGVKSWKEI